MSAFNEAVALIAKGEHTMNEALKELRRTH